MKIKLTLLIIFFLVLNNVYAERIEVTGGGGGGGSTYTAGGTLLNLTGTAFSVKEGTLTTTKGCKYVTGTGLVCDQDYLITETDPLSATKALNNLASVAINTSLISDTAATDDLGTEAIYWRKLYLGSDISFEGAADDTYQTTLTAVDTTLSDKSINIPNASGTMAVSATAPMTVSALGDIGVTVAKDIVAGVGLSGGEDNVLPGADADTTLTFDATELGALTWSDNSLASIAWTWNLSGTDDTVTFGSDLVTFSNSLTVATGKNIKLGTTQWNSGDSIDGTKIANADLGEIGVSSGVWSVENATVIGKLLTGYSSGAGTVATTDTILQAFNKLNGNDATNANLTGEVTSVGNAATIADSVAVSSWNLTTPTITTSLTTSTPTTLTAAELDRLDGLAGVIVTDTTACTEIDGNGLTITTGTLNFDGGDAPGGELGGTWATPTIDDSVAVTSWALTTPTITTSAAWNADPADTGAIRLSNADYIWAEASPAGTDISVIGVDATEIIQIGASGASGVTITPTVTITGDLTVNGDDIQLGATGVKITDDTDGAITFLGLSAGFDESLTFNFDDVENTVGVTSGSGVTKIDFGAMNLATTVNQSGEPHHFRATIIDPATAYGKDTQICIVPKLDAAITVTNLEVTCNADPTTEPTGDIKYADTFIGLANATVINDFDTTAGVRTDSTITSGAVATGKAIYIQFDTTPDATLTQMSFDLTWDYD